MNKLRRPAGRPFCLLLAIVFAAAALHSSTPTMTSILDTVYRADGLPASGVLLVSWPAFTTANGQPVAAGTKSVPLGNNGALAGDLVPNAGANPSGTYYTVVFQLGDVVRTEYWTVPTTSPATLATVRTTLGSGGASQLVSRQYVDSALGAKATDALVVHKSGGETIDGTKQFSAAPSVPTPLAATDAVNKAYVDAAVANVGSGSYVQKAGDTMSGPLTLPADPTSPYQASTRHYVDNGLAAKAGLVNGLVPSSQLGSGSTNGANCLKGDSSWGACGTSSNAVSIQGVAVDPAAPADGQVITYEATSGKYKPKPGSGSGGLTPGMQAIKYATDFNWTQSPTTDLSSAGAKTISLTACTAGVSGAESEYFVYIAGTGTAEAVKVTGGTCTGNGAAGTLAVTTVNAHPTGYTLSSASGGLQEAAIAARFTPTNPTGTSQSGKVIAPPGEIKLYARVSFRAANQTIDFSGSIFECWMNDTCLFVGDGLSLKFYLSQIPFTRSSKILVDEEYALLDPTRWTVVDPGSVISVSGGKLLAAGGTGVDGQTVVKFIDSVELGGAITLQHGVIAFSGASDGVLGGLYASAISVSGCLAGFRILPSGADSRIQALINGVLNGTVITTQKNHLYALTTRFYAAEVYRRKQTFHSSVHPGGSGRGGDAIAANVRVVLEIQDIDPANPGSLVAPSTVLYDDVIANAPDLVTYALVNASNLRTNISFTRILQAVDAEVRSALPDALYRTRLVGALAEGAECHISTEPALQFFPQSVPAANEQIVVSYRGSWRSMARVINLASIATEKGANDDGVRGVVRNIATPSARTSSDCENAALALLDESRRPAWSGEYRCWSDFLPGQADDVFPGDGIVVTVLSQGASFGAIVHEVSIQIADLCGEHSLYRLQFADSATQPVAFAFDAQHVSTALNIPAVDATTIGTNCLADLTGAAVTQVASTSIRIDCGLTPGAGDGIEVRSTDYGWGQSNDRNLVARFTTRTFSVPRLARVQSYFLRQYDSSSPAKYSRYSAALHVDYPL